MRRFNYLILLVIIIGVAALVPLQRWIDSQTGDRVAEESLYLPSGKTVKKISFGFDGIVSDVYWMRAIQYFGRNVLSGGLAENSNERFELLYPLLDITTTLDPQYIAAYEFGGMFVADYNSKEKAISLLQRGIQENPTEWRLYQYLGMIYWKQQDYSKASETFERGSQVPGAAQFMHIMSAQMLAEGGSRATARQMFQQIYKSTDDKRIQDSMVAKLKRLYALDQIDCLTHLVSVIKERKGQYPSTLDLRYLAATLGPDLTQQMKAWPGLDINPDKKGLAADPDGFAFAYNNHTGEISLSPDTTILKK